MGGSLWLKTFKGGFVLLGWYSLIVGLFVWLVFRLGWVARLFYSVSALLGLWLGCFAGLGVLLVVGCISFYRAVSVAWLGFVWCGLWLLLGCCMARLISV